MKDIQEIKSAVSKFRLDTTWQRLRKRWEEDFDYYRLEPYDAGKNYYSYTSNSPRNLANRGIGLMTGAKLMIRIPVDTLNKEEREIANNVERYDYGVLNMNDDRLAEDSMPTVRDQLSWYLGMRGSVAICPYVYKESDGNTFPEFRIRDPYNTAYSTGKRGFSWIAFTRTLTKGDIKDTYGIDIAKRDADVIEFWDTENFGIIVDNQWAVELRKHGLDHCPGYIIEVGAQPPIWQQKYQYTNIHKGESLFAATRGLFPLLNKTMSDYLTIVRRGVKPPIGVWSRGGQENLEEDIWQVEHGVSTPFDLDTKVAPIIEPTMPGDAKDFVNFIMGEIQRGGISHVAQGELGFRLSGYAIQSLQAALDVIIHPFIDTLQRAYRLGLRELQQQYANGNWKPVEVRGRTSKNTPFGVPKAIKIKPKDIKEDWRPEITLSAVFPRDDAQRLEMARIATEGENPLLSVETAREKLIGVEDTDLESEKVSKEWSRMLPIIRLWEAFKAAMADKDTDKAYNIVAELERLMAGQTEPGGGAQARRGMSARTMPPETLGGIPGGAANARVPVEAAEEEL